MSSRGPRPVRNLAAWGYESSTTDSRIEVDVWTVNRVESDDQELADPSDFGVGIDEVLAQAGDVAKVVYSGAAGVGYRRVSSDERVSQQAFAGAARSAGTTRTDAGTFDEGGFGAVIGPSLDDVVAVGERDVLPVVRREFQELGQKIGREPSRDEDEEPVETEPFDNFRNVVRVFPRGGDVFRYRVRGEVLVQA